MSLDTTYRPRVFSDVVGQDGTVSVLRQFVKSGSGFHQSYVFCGSYGSGKTTLARILARALLCEAPVNGDPCDRCSSCLEILESNGSLTFVEVDAATQSGTEDMRRIVEQVSYDGFAGRRRIFLFDEAHRLTKGALDALLKPMEDCVPGSSDKQLVCIFCTTEPESMRATIFSRCAPSFVVQKVSPDVMAQRLAWICDLEKIPYELPALVLVSELVECHFRNALKAIEGASQVGAVSEVNVRSYLKLAAIDLYLGVLYAIGRDSQALLKFTAKLKDLVSPTVAYVKLSELAMMVFRHGIGAGKVPAYLRVEWMTKIWSAQQDFMLRVAQLLSSRPGHPTFSMLDCDLSLLHAEKTGRLVVPQATAAKAATTCPVDSSLPSNFTESSGNVGSAKTADKPPLIRASGLTRNGVYIDANALRGKEKAVAPETPSDPTPGGALDAAAFRAQYQRLVPGSVNGGGT